MKYAVLFSILVAPLAFAEGEAGKSAEGEGATTTPPKTEETVTLSAEATAPLFERIRGAHLRALQTGKVVAVKAGK